MGDTQRTALERALDHDGKVSRTDYMAAWSNYRQCMVDKGYNEPPLHMVNGLVVELMHFDFSGMSDQQQMKFHQDQSACLEQESLYVASAYSDSIVNPELYVDLDVALLRLVCKDVFELAAVDEASLDVAGGVGEAHGVAAQGLEPAVDGFGGSVA